MADEPEEPQIAVELDGSESGADTEIFRGQVTAYEIDSDFLTATDGWSITVFDEERPRDLRRTFRPLRGIRLYIDGNLQLVGRIDKTHGGEGSSLVVSGRDYLADACDGGVDPSLKFLKGVDIGDAILAILKPFGITTIASGGFALTRNILTGQRPYFGAPARDYKAAKLEDFKATPGLGAFELASKIAAHHGFLLQPVPTDPASIALCEPEFRQSPLYQISRYVDGLEGNALTSSASRDYSRVPTVTLATGAGGGSGGATVARTKAEIPTFSSAKSPGNLASNTEVQRIITAPNNVIDVVEKRRDPRKPDPTVYGSKRPRYCPMFYEDKEARNTEQLERGMRRMIADRVRETLVYTCTVRGHTDPDSGATWAVDTIAFVQDAVEDVSEPLWVQQRRFANDGGGATTQLQLIRPGSFVL